jgi:hypothetical protein
MSFQNPATCGLCSTCSILTVTSASAAVIPLHEAVIAQAAASISFL